jgi:alkanesulfonate monooxygenase SsuD/methylene tetrahydromethanopterin reductase-like flavin-dependent oxidoreductase (luciferase family)
MGIARQAARDAGRDPDALVPIVCAPAYVGDDIAHARDQVRWFPAMVSNHVMDLLAKYPESELPPALYEYVKRRTFYDYKDHSRVGAAHGEFVDDETCDRFCVLGTPEDHIRKLKELEAIGVGHWNIYLMTEGQEHVLESYGKEIMPGLRQGAAAGSTG